MLALNQHYYVLDLYEKEVVHFSYDMCESIQVMNIMNAKRQSEHDKSVISCAYNFDLELCMFPGCTRKAQIEAMYQDIGKDELKRTKVCNTHIRYLHNLVKVVATKSIPET